ncbi:hypothetical protein ACFX13_023738 [Malus domestica]
MASAIGAPSSSMLLFANSPPASSPSLSLSTHLSLAKTSPKPTTTKTLASKPNSSPLLYSSILAATNVSTVFHPPPSPILHSPDGTWEVRAEEAAR